MKGAFESGVLALLVVLFSPSPTCAQSGATQKAIVALEQRWYDAEKANRPDQLAPLLADEMVNTFDGVVTGKQELLASAKSVKWKSGAYDSLRVLIFGDVGIATGILRRKGVDGASGKPFVVNERFTDTWVKMRSGQWQCVASHGSTIKL
jgi:ketosteroid isomerase-like protein